MCIYVLFDVCTVSAVIVVVSVVVGYLVWHHFGFGVWKSELNQHDVLQTYCIGNSRHFRAAPLVQFAWKLTATTTTETNRRLPCRTAAATATIMAHNGKRNYYWRARVGMRVRPQRRTVLR